MPPKPMGKRLASIAKITGKRRPKKMRFGKELIKQTAHSAVLTIMPLLLFIVCMAAHAAAGSGLTEIADNVYSYVDIKNASPGNSYGANAGIVVGRDCVAVVDTLISAKEAQRFIRDIRAVTDKPIRYVINTHWHLDHAFGNTEFAKLGAVIISHALDRKTLAEKGANILKHAADYGLTDAGMEGTTVAMPQLSFTGRIEIDLGDLRLELIAAENSHTGGSIFVHVPDRKVVFAGDVLFTGYHPYMAEGHIKGWLAALDTLANLQASAIVPGHGPVSMVRDIRAMKAYIALFDRESRRLAAQSKDVDAIYAELKKILPDRPEADFLIRSNIRLRYMKEKH